LILRKVVESTELRRIFGLKREEIRGDRRSLHTEASHTLHQRDKIKEDEMGGACSAHGEDNIRVDVNDNRV
jgi:hypothetical protein